MADYKKPLPTPTYNTKPFWDAAKQHKLLIQRCKACGTYFFPKETTFCRNPRCAGSEFEEVPLSTRGRLWSFTDNRYAPPKPYMAGDPFEPYAVAAVELERLDDEVLAGAGARHVRDFRRLRIDELREQRARCAGPRDCRSTKPHASASTCTSRPIRAAGSAA